MKISAKILPLVLSGGFIMASNADVPHSFVNGSEANATQVNENFSYLEERINSLDSSQSGDRQEISADCSADTRALAKYLYWDGEDFGKYEYTTFLLSGTCDGPIYIYGDGVRLQSADEGSKATLQLPDNLEDPERYLVRIEGADDVRLRNLVIDASSYSDSNYEGDNIATVSVRRSFVEIEDAKIDGGITAVDVIKDSRVVFEGENSIENFHQMGLNIWSDASVESNGFISIIGKNSVNMSSNWFAAVSVSSSSLLSLNAGSDIEIPNTSDSSFNIIYLSRNSSLEFNNYSGDAIHTVQGDVSISDVGVLQMGSGTTINGTVYNSSASVIDMSNGSFINGGIFVQVDSVLDVWGGSKINGFVNVSGGSSINLNDAAIAGSLYLGNSSNASVDSSEINGTVEINYNSSMYTQGNAHTTNVNGDLNLYVDSTTALHNSSVSGNILIHTNSSLALESSHVGFINANGSSLRANNGSTFGGGNFHALTDLSIYNSQTTDYILSSGNTAVVYIYTDDGAGNFIVRTDYNALNGNTLYMCDNPNSLEGYSSSTGGLQSAYGGYIINSCIVVEDNGTE